MFVCDENSATTTSYPDNKQQNTKCSGLTKKPHIIGLYLWIDDH